MTKRQTEVLERLERGVSVKRIAKDIGVTPAAVYQTIDRLRRGGHLPEGFTPSGAPPRSAAGLPGAPSATTFAADRLPSRLSEMREREDDEERLAELIDAAIAAGDAAALAYCLGRADARGEDGLRGRIVEAALRRLGLLAEPETVERRAPVAAANDRPAGQDEGESAPPDRQREET